MSQTETVLLVVLGFALATLLALFVGRFAWRLALRLGAKRMQKQVPSTVKELQTERDRLRADYALLSQKLGSHLASVKDRMAEQMAEVTRSRNRIQSLTEEVNAREQAIAGRDQEIAALKERVADLESALAAAAADAARLNGEIALRDDRIRTLEGEATALAIGRHALPPDLDAATATGLSQRIQKLADLSGEIAAARQQGGNAAAEPPPGLNDKLAEAEKETAALQQELARLDAVWAGKLGDVGTEGGSGNAPAVANVISLAQRIRSLHKDAG